MSAACLECGARRFRVVDGVYAECDECGADRLRTVVDI